MIGSVKQYYNDQQEPLKSRSWNEIPSSNVYWELSCERGDGSRTGQGNSSTPGKIFNPMMGIWHLWKESGWRRSRIGKEVIWLQHTSDKVTANPIESSKIKIPHSSILTWRIPWTEEPGRQQSMGWQRVRHDWARAHTHAPGPGLRSRSATAGGQLPRKALPFLKGQRQIPKVLTTGSSQLTTLLPAGWQILSWKKIQAACHHGCHDINKYKHQHENHVINYLRWTAAY